MIDENRSSSLADFLRPAGLIAGCVLALALILVPFAWTKTGSGGMAGLAFAAGLCLGTAWLAEGLTCVLHRSATPLVMMLLGMAIRMVPPLGICLALAAQGATGRQHLLFLCYLLTFYLLTLALETWLTARRVTRTPSHMSPSAR